MRIRRSHSNLGYPIVKLQRNGPFLAKRCLVTTPTQCGNVDLIVHYISPVKRERPRDAFDESSPYRRLRFRAQLALEFLNVLHHSIPVLLLVKVLLNSRAYTQPYFGNIRRISDLGQNPNKLRPPFILPPPQRFRSRHKTFLHERVPATFCDTDQIRHFWKVPGKSNFGGS